MEKTSNLLILFALALAFVALAFSLTAMLGGEAVFAFSIIAVLLSLIVISPKRANESLNEEISRIKGLKEEMAERGKLNILLRLIGPIVLYFVFLGILYLLVNPSVFPEVLSAVLLYLVALGKEMVAPVAAGLVESYASVTLPLMVIALAFDDIICGLWMVLNWDVVKFIPFLGKYLDQFEKSSQETVQERSWLGRFSTLGLALLVTFPMRGSGGITGPIVGKLLGLRGRNIFIAVVAGGLAGFAILVPAFYYAMGPIKQFFGVTSTWGITAIMVGIVLAVIVSYRLIQKKRED